jgi:hypothetical protein
MTRRFARFLRRNTIALLALFIALGGTTYAATALPKNSVGPKQLRKNAVTNKKIAKNAVTGAKVKNDSLTGGDILESSLGRVPSAESADTVAKSFHTGIVKVAAGQMQNVAVFAPFTVYLKCNDLGSGVYRVQWFISTTEDHSAFAGVGSGNGDFGPATVETSRQLAAYQSANPVYFSPYSIDVAAAAPSGPYFNAVGTTGVHTLGTGCVGSLDGFTS